jgi:hypothetical protein
LPFPQKTKKQLSYSQEKLIAKRLNGKTTIASGALWFQKGDIKANGILVEAKATSSKALSVKSSVWKKIENEAVRRGLVPAMALQMKDEQGRDIHLAVISMDEFVARFS